MVVSDEYQYFVYIKIIKTKNTTNTIHQKWCIVQPTAC